MSQTSSWADPTAAAPGGLHADAAKGPAAGPSTTAASPVTASSSAPDAPDHRATVPDQRLASALARLQLSRAQLHGAMLPSGKPRPAPSGAFGAAWRQTLQDAPLLGLVWPAIQQAWRAHPWGQRLQELGDSVQSTIGPLVRRHPLAAVGVAAQAGASLVACRPWRLLRGRRLPDPLRALPGDWARQFWRSLGDAPMQMAVSALTAWLLNAQRDGTPTPPAPNPPERNTP